MYLLSSKTRSKQYLGNATEDFRSRWNNKEGDVKKVESVKMENVKQAFAKPLLQSDRGGFHENVEVALS